MSAAAVAGSVPAAPAPAGPTLEQKALTLGADLVLEGGGVKGIGLAGAVVALAERGYTFPRVGGTSAGAIVACLVAAYQKKGVPLTRIVDDMNELSYTRFRDQGRLQRAFGPLGRAAGLLAHQGVYRTDYLAEWLTGKLEPLGIRTFGDLRISDDEGTGLPRERQYRLVVHASDLTRKCLVRIPWDLPQYLVAPEASKEEQWKAIDDYPVVDAVRASMSIPWFFRPFTQRTHEGTCTWVDGGLLENFPITVFDRTDGRANRWPTFGIKLSGRPKPDITERSVLGNVAEFRAVAATALGQWNRYALTDEGVDARTVWVDTDGIQATEFGITDAQQKWLYENGRSAASAFLAHWDHTHEGREETTAAA